MRWNTGALCVVALAVGVSVASFVPGLSQSLRNVVGLRGQGPEAHCLGKLPPRKGQDIAPRVAPVERVPIGIPFRLAVP